MRQRAVGTAGVLAQRHHEPQATNRGVAKQRPQAVGLAKQTAPGYGRSQPTPVRHNMLPRSLDRLTGHSAKIRSPSRVPPPNHRHALTRTREAVEEPERPEPIVALPAGGFRLRAARASRAHHRLPPRARRELGDQGGQEVDRRQEVTRAEGLRVQQRRRAEHPGTAVGPVRHDGRVADAGACWQVHRGNEAAPAVRRVHEAQPAAGGCGNAPSEV
mmetsp:Transcript_60696/g.172531  ORF Transcript_60696/g.172531 Transcript_60696/m.172531 type:complete len:216 (-) Transcript_60696:83-730(-)